MKCEKPMQTKLVRGVEIDICADCGSVWLDGGELKSLAGLDYNAGRILACPDCEEQLQTKMIRGVEVDVCPGCAGVYLDRGEMEKLSGIEPAAGGKTDIGQFLHDTYGVRLEMAIKTYMEGTRTKPRGNNPNGHLFRGFNLLTSREKQVFQFLVEGYTSSQIGEELGISYKTIDKHRTSIYKKIGVDNPVQMLQYALRIGVNSPQDLAEHH